MQSTTMWIILGVLIVIVIVFLSVTQILDKKKKKKLRLELEKKIKKIREVSINTAKQVMKIVEKNRQLLKKFVPSIGDFSMSEINEIAKKSIKDIMNTKDYKMILDKDSLQKDIDLNLKKLLANRSNNWDKKNLKEIEFFQNFKPVIKKEKPKKSKFQLLAEKFKSKKRTKKNAKDSK